MELDNRVSTHLFGKKIQRTLYPHVGNNPVQIPSQALSIYLFDERPDRDNAADGTGALKSATGFAFAPLEPYGVSYEFEAVTNPEPSDKPQTCTYWEGVNFVSELGGAVQTVIRSLTLSDPEELDEVPATTVDDVTRAFPSILNYLTNEKIEGFLSDAEADTKEFFIQKGLRWARLYDLSRVRRAIAFKVISDSSLALIQNVNDKHDYRYQTFRQRYRDELTAIALPYDSDGDGQPDTTVKPRQGFYMVAK